MGLRHTLYACCKLVACLHNLPDPMNHIKMFKGQPRQFALWKLVSNS